jgi:hypothetical protein
MRASRRAPPRRSACHGCACGDQMGLTEGSSLIGEPREYSGRRPKLSGDLDFREDDASGSSCGVVDR